MHFAVSNRTAHKRPWDLIQTKYPFIIFWNWGRTRVASEGVNCFFEAFSQTETGPEINERYGIRFTN
jgi:hypothetical protein